MPKTVWVLGAGFPRSLGAPLLDDLFRQEHRDQIAAYFPDPGFPNLSLDIFTTQVAFNWGKSVEQLWNDAEEFLAFVDEACSGGAPEKNYRLDLLANRATMYHPQLKVHVPLGEGVQERMRKDLRRASRRALAAETSRFMMSDQTSELWFPYREWAKGLRSQNDTIVTFNYDMLLDSLETEEGFTIPMPHEEPASGCVPVFKLHGSVNWVENGTTYTRMRPVEALTEPTGKVPAIATPGRSKSPNALPPFPGLWNHAEKALAQAQWVIFLGYRFPPTDAVAKHRLLAAIRKNSPGYYRRFDTVLGPDIESDRSRRLFRLLESARAGRVMLQENEDWSINSRYLKIVRQPLYAEDFLLTYVEFGRDERWA